MRLEPLGYNVILKMLKEPEKTQGGIVLPDQSRTTSVRAEVVAVGEGYLQPDNTVRPLKVSVGDIVIPAFGGTLIVADDGTEFVVLSERDILARVLPTD